MRADTIQIVQRLFQEEMPMGDPIDLHLQPLIFFAEEICPYKDGWIGIEKGGCSYYTNVAIVKSTGDRIPEGQIELLRKALSDALKNCKLGE
jgi:hypothetical protein